MSEVSLLHAQAYIRSLPADQRKALMDPATLEVELAKHGIDTMKLTPEEKEVLRYEITDGGGAPGAVSQPGQVATASGVSPQAVLAAESSGVGSPPVQASTPTITDRGDLQQRIQTVLDTDQRICDFSIDALVSGPMVTLTGMVRKPDQKRLVEQIVREIPGVTSIVNDIQVR